MHPNFSLEDKDTFCAVFPWTQIEGGLQQSDHPQQSSKLLQEKVGTEALHVHRDTSRQISLRSESFFLAMSSQDKLQENMIKTCSAIKLLREKVHRLEEVLVAGPLKLMKLSQSRANLVKLFNKLRLMATVHQTQPTLQLLLATNEFVGALDLIATTQEVLAQELTGLNSFRHLGSQLTEMEGLIDKMMQEDFVRYATADLNRPLTDGASTMDELRLNDCVGCLQEKLIAIVLGMLRQGKLEFIHVYRQEACTTVKTVIKQTVIEAVAAMEDIDLNTTTLADQMRLLDYKQWVELLSQVFSNLLIVLTRTKVVCWSITSMLDLPSPVRETLQANGGEDDLSREEEEEEDGEDTEAETDTNHTTCAAESMQRNSSQLTMGGDVDMSMTTEDRLKVYTSVTDMLSYVCDYAHDRCVKLMLARGREGSLERLTASEFVQLSRVIEGFASETHALCGHRSTSLRASLQGQVNKFVNRFHEERKTKLR
ncbi:hypothetical protein NP493_359g01050 [Ridgeia piscesae]|uniref:Vacuolar protein sorting-associated protein 54 N-terminal domain-containing protein n=1 Tax=Ridgeia piscesae TaxID=27915 RepID=A0AAD9NTX1_RIDPI|nr:hypothetical protein NP493_359g01050 [Ridgeia piscesae]